MSECLRCGCCCRVISLDKSLQELRILADAEAARCDLPPAHVDDRARLLRDVTFMLRHFSPVPSAEALAINPRLRDQHDRHFYRCDALASDGTCRQHAERPYLCAGYPWYAGAPNPALLVHLPCGYE